jgi:membrane-bound metal-dependent hydrolase YbcI (DUF457 family)
MKAQTHILFGILLYALAIRFYFTDHSLILFLLIVCASILPDIDVITSFFGKATWVFALAFRHRGIVHSWVFLVLFSFIVYYIFGIAYAIVFGISYLGHLLLDGLNPGGVAIFFPSKKRMKGFIGYKSILEYLLIAALVVVDIALFL